MELIIQCDENGKIIGPIDKKYAHSEGQRQRLTHYSTWSMVFSTSGEYGIQLKSKKKHDKFNAGKWDMGVAGHNSYVKKDGVLKPLSFKETLVKEADEEIGLPVEVIDSLEEFLEKVTSTLQQPIAFFFDTFHLQTKEDNEFVGLAFILTPSSTVSFKDKEVVEFRWLSPKELSLFLEEGNDYCPYLPIVFEKAEQFRKKYLHNSPLFST